MNQIVTDITEYLTFAAYMINPVDKETISFINGLQDW